MIYKTVAAILVDESDGKSKHRARINSLRTNPRVFSLKLHIQKGKVWESSKKRLSGTQSLK